MVILALDMENVSMVYAHVILLIVVMSVNTKVSIIEYLVS